MASRGGVIMKFIKIDTNEFNKNRDKIIAQIISAQNTPINYAKNVREYYTNVFLNNKAVLYACMVNNEFIAVETVCFYPEIEKFCLINVNTRKDFQNKKVATRLTDFALADFFATHKDTPMYLWVHPDNFATNMYKHLGFKTSNENFSALPFYNNIKDDEIYICTQENFLNRYERSPTTSL